MKITKQSTSIFGNAFALITLASSLSAAPVQWSGNGHWYDLVLDNTSSWTQASAAASAQGGYLVTITSQGEQDFVESLLINSAAPSGAYWLDLTATTLENFSWANGEPLSYTHWDTGEPNGNSALPNGWGFEDSGQIIWTSDQDSGLPLYSRRGGWNDIRNLGWAPGESPGPSAYDLNRAGYIIETVPEPSAIALLSLSPALLPLLKGRPRQNLTSLPLLLP
jgi:hypothetical protein